jgi:hypothetical protein
VYLYRNENLAFNDLTSTEQARAAFRRFARVYNSGELEEAYYDDPSGAMPLVAVNEIKTTRHRWKFATATTTTTAMGDDDKDQDDEKEKERKQLERLHRGVRQQTEYGGGGSGNGSGSGSGAGAAGSEE